MASLYEYFVKDGAQNLTLHEKWPLTNAEGVRLGEVIARLHLDFDANAKYISFFIPATAGDSPEDFLLNEVSGILGWPETKVEVQNALGGERRDARELAFTGRIYFYSDRPVHEPHKAKLNAKAKEVGQLLVFRSVEYADERNKWEKPRAFISHDSRDKEGIAEPIALQLEKLMCPVWYDDFSLRIGDSLRESIERGLKECAKCVLVLTPNFLSNKGWSKREYDSIFTRELVEKQKVILPIWHGVSATDVYLFSPILADRVAVQWSVGVEEVARKLMQAIYPPG